jgi:hypothetical protein
MKKTPTEYAGLYQGIALIADPIYRYASFTVPTTGGADEKTEKDLIDSPWLQRLRRIFQLQSARWVYPAAEHTRFQHSLGTMHTAGEFGRHLYGSLKEVCPDVPSSNCVEELLRWRDSSTTSATAPTVFLRRPFPDSFGLTHGTWKTDHHQETPRVIGRIRAAPRALLERERPTRRRGLPDQDARRFVIPPAPLASSPQASLLGDIHLTTGLMSSATPS